MLNVFGKALVFFSIKGKRFIKVILTYNSNSAKVAPPPSDLVLEKREKVEPDSPGPLKEYGICHLPYGKS